MGFSDIVIKNSNESLNIDDKFFCALLTPLIDHHKATLESLYRARFMTDN